VLSETRSELGRVSDSFSDASMTGDSQRVELMALRAQVEVLKGQIESYEKETQGLHERITAKTSEIEITNQQLIEERGKTDSLGNRVGELDRGLVAQTTEAEILSRRVQELTAKLDEQGRFLAEREYATDQLRQESSAAQKLEADLRGELSDLEQRRRVVTEGLTAEKTILETQLRQAQDERTKLLADIEKMKREADAAWAAERMENAVMRERINDVAAEVARLTSLLEGPGSTVDAILAEATPSRPTAPTNGNGNGNGHVAAADSKGSLADRIRALQARASRLPQAGRA
jgi:chromosome segregation ATPase